MQSLWHIYSLYEYQFQQLQLIKYESLKYYDITNIFLRINAVLFVDAWTWQTVRNACDFEISSVTPYQLKWGLLATKKIVEFMLIMNELYLSHINYAQNNFS